MAHQINCEPCAYCRNVMETQKRRRLARHAQRKAHLEAKRDAIKSGKLAVITLRDELTGFFYRYDKNGRIVTLGSGHNYGA